MTGELGYLISGTQHPSTLGCLQLDVNLYDRPTGQHFDPEQAAFPVANQEGEIKRRVIAHPWRSVKAFHVCVGRTILRDRLNKKVEAFSFGGELAIEVEKSYTECLLRSTAPIFALTDVHGLSVMFVSRVESLLARKHAEWKNDDCGFERRLVDVDPAMLFVAALAAVSWELEQTPTASRGERFWHHLGAIRVAIQNMKRGGTWPTPTPSLDEMLARSH
jgi:hypothetical protein